MEPTTPEYTRLRSAITERLNAHDLLGVMDLGAPEDETTRRWKISPR